MAGGELRLGTDSIYMASMMPCAASNASVFSPLTWLHLRSHWRVFAVKSTTWPLEQWKVQLKVADLNGRSVVVHAGADTYSDQPKPLGGGGARVACGVVPMMKMKAK
jgi:hypothetical protein